MKMNELIEKAKDHLRDMDDLDIKLYKELSLENGNEELIKELKRKIYIQEGMTRAYLRHVIETYEKQEQ